MNIEYWNLLFVQKLTVQQYAKSTISNYSGTLNKFLISVALKFDNPVKISVSDIEDYIQWCIDQRNISPSYQRLVVSSIEKFYDLVFDRQIEIKHLNPVREISSLSKYLTKEEIWKMVEHTSNIKHKCILLFLYSAHLELHELINLQRENIDIPQRLILLDTKEEGRRTIEMSPYLQATLDAYLEKQIPTNYLFEGKCNGKFSTTSVQNVVKRAALRANIIKSITPRVIRKSLTDCATIELCTDFV